ncbi:MAG: EboA domain-containing protein [Bacteroidia bacterium]
MIKTVYQADLTEVKNFLLSKLSEVLIPDKYSELKYMLDELRDKQQSSAIYIAFSKVVRMFGKAPINYKPGQVEQADIIRKNWLPPSSVDKAIRVLILFEIPHEHDETYINTLEELFGSGDMGELIALYSALPVLPYPDQLIKRCEEGIRTNMGDVFESVGNNNPFPADYLSEDAFNQMVLKCMFIGKPLYKVINLNHRLNKALAVMALDYAHERWAALRKINPELWQLIAPFLESKDLKDVERSLWTGDELERRAVVLACAESQSTEMLYIYNESNYKQQIESGELNWFTIGVEVWRNN